MRVRTVVLALPLALICSCALLGGGREGLKDEPIVEGNGAPAAATEVTEAPAAAGAGRDGDCFSASTGEVQGATAALLGADGFGVAVLGDSIRASRRVERTAAGEAELRGGRYRVKVGEGDADLPLSLRLRLSFTTEDSLACLSGRASTVGFVFGEGEFERFMNSCREDIAAEIGRQRESAGPPVHN